MPHVLPQLHLQRLSIASGGDITLGQLVSSLEHFQCQLAQPIAELLLCSTQRRQLHATLQLTSVESK